MIMEVGEPLEDQRVASQGPEEVPPYKKPPRPEPSRQRGGSPFVESLEVAMYKEMRRLPDGTEEIAEGAQRTWVKAIVNNPSHDVPTFKAPPPKMPMKSEVPKGSEEIALVKAPPLIKAPPPTSIPMPIVAKSQPKKGNGLS